MNAWLNEPLIEAGDCYSLPYVMIRADNVSHWRGYVGVCSRHPLHGKHYNEAIEVPRSILERPIDIDKMGAINIFAANPPEDGKVDLVLAFDVHGGITWANTTYETMPDGVDAPKDFWWFGFDCAHAGDFIPKYEQYAGINGNTWRDVRYVRGETEALAKQLARWVS